MHLISVLNEERILHIQCIFQLSEDKRVDSADIASMAACEAQISW